MEFTPPGGAALRATRSGRAGTGRAPAAIRHCSNDAAVDPGRLAAQLESARTVTDAESLRPRWSACPHLRPLGSVVTAVHDTFAWPVASGATDNGTVVNPLIRACESTTAFGPTVMSYTVTRMSSVPSFVMLT